MKQSNPNRTAIRILGALLAIVAITTPILLGACSIFQPDPTERQATQDLALLQGSTTPVSFNQQVKPILDRRCVVCHGCYDAPCQLKLSSYEGLDRGGNPQKVYDGTRIFPADPTRLFIDAKTTAQWRDKGFHAVLDEQAGTPEQHLQRSVLYKMLSLKRLHPQPRSGMLPDSFDLDLNRSQSCPTQVSFATYARKNPLWGMPYAMPDLTDAEYQTLVRWIAAGSPGPAPAESSPEAKPRIARWETFLNGSSDKQRLMSRYLYEHLFIAHIHLDGTPTREFFRLVRSRTPPGQPIDEIATVRPFDDPGSGPFYYRLRLYHPSIVAKDHVVYQWSDERMARYRELFLEPAYPVSGMPSYEPAIASNPFKTFAAIPVQSRYRFLLDDTRFFIEGFMKGPVCRGQVALNVIEDQFWIFFVDPDSDVMSLNSAFLDRMADYLQLPADRGNTLNVVSIWTDYWKRQKRYMAAQEESFKQIHAVNLEQAMDYIWDGDGNNPNAALTIFRHFDSASVTWGLKGDYPETAWIIDYPLLERIHYLLVAGFDVYGNVGHQLNTRIFMDFLRMEGEDYFLAFLPASRRKAIRDSWYMGIRAEVDKEFQAPMDWLSVESVIGYQTDNPQRELYQHLERRLGPMAGPPDHLSRCSDENCRDPDAGPVEARFDAEMRRIAQHRGRQLNVFPDVTFLRVRLDETGDHDIAYTVILNKGYKNITSVFEDEDRRDRDNDTLTVIKGFEGVYPNFFLAIEPDNLKNFADRFLEIQTFEDYEAFVGSYGIRRTNPDFWTDADWFQAEYARNEPLRAGLFDLNRYGNR